MNEEGKQPNVVLRRALAVCLGATLIVTPLAVFAGSKWLGRFAQLAPVSELQTTAFVLCASLCGALLAANWFVSNSVPKVALIWWFAIGAQVLSIVVGVFVADDVSYGMSRSLAPLSGVVFFLASLEVLRREGAFERFFVLWSAIGVVLCVVAGLQFAGLAGSLQVGGDVAGKLRIASLIGHPNHFASALLPILFITLSIRATGKWAIARAIAIMIMTVTLVLTGVRGAWLGALIGAGVYCLLERRCADRSDDLPKWAVQSIPVVVVILVVFIGLPFGLRERLTSDAEARSRLLSWAIAVDLAKERPIVGHGLGSYEAKFWDAVARRQALPEGQWTERSVVLMAGVHPRHAHNEFLNIAAEQGQLGVLALSLLIACGLSAAWWLRRQSRVSSALGAGVVACLVDACFMFPFSLPLSLAGFVFLLAALATFEARPS